MTAYALKSYNLVPVISMISTILIKHLLELSVDET